MNKIKKKLYACLASLFFISFSSMWSQNTEVDEFQKLLGTTQEEDRTEQEKSLLKEKSNVSTEDVFEEAKEKKFRWKFLVKDILEVKKDADQYIILNGRKIHRQVNHRVLLDVKDISKRQGYNLEGTFYSSFRYFLKSENPYRHGESFYSNFYLKPRGDMVVDKETFMPNIRGLPTFPFDEDQISEGFTWQMPGEEIVQSGGKFLHIPLEVFYEYHGKTEATDNEGNKRTLHKIFMNYQIDYKSSVQLAGEIQSMYGYASVHLLWNEQSGIPYKASEVYDIMIRYGDGQFHEFRIKSQSSYKKIKPMSYAEKLGLQENLKERLAKFRNTTEAPSEVQIKKSGLSLQIPQILFEYNSDKLTERSKRILRDLIPVLEKHKERYFVIRGHTDNIGSSAYNQELSAERAKAVTHFLMENSKLDSNHLSYEGVGFLEPIASNSNEQSRAKNRRVEIFIPEK